MMADRGSESESVFESLNLNPQLFINETLNAFDDLLDDAFHFFHQEASNLLKTEGTDKSQYLNMGVADIRNIIQSDLDVRLGMWETYCLHHCFAVPKGFSFPKNKESSDESLMCQDVICDAELDAQLDSLRDRLIMVRKESAELNRELLALEKQSASSDRCTVFVNEALQLYEQNSVQGMFQEMVRTASELRTKMEKLRTRKMENIECIGVKRICNPNGDLSTSKLGKGISNVNLEDLQEFLAGLKNM